MRRILLPLLFISLFAVSLTKHPGYTCKTCYKTLDDTVFNVGDVISFYPVRFNLNKCTLLPDMDSVFNQSDSLMQVVQFIHAHPTFTFELRTHTDYVNPNMSQKLTTCRAQSIVDRLVSLGVERDRLLARGIGDTEPYLPSGDSVLAEAVLTHKFIAAKSKTADDREFLNRQNRRSDLKIVRMDYVPPVDTTKH